MSNSRVILEVVAGPHEGELREFAQYGTLVVGRGSEAELRLPKDLHFSRNHFRVEVKPPEVRLVDLDSSNGTFVNGERVADVWLHNGDTISGGRTQIAVRVEDEGGDETSEYVMFGAPEIGTTVVPESGPASVAHYDIVSELGSGTMGVVYHARDRNTGEEVALKVVAPKMRPDDAAIRSFLREAKILKQLDHKRIVRFVETGVANGGLFLAMEYVPAIDLTTTLSKLSLEQRCRMSCGLIRQILDGLAYAHKRDLVHRDIKPKNLLVAKRPTGLSAKLADFGLAKNYMDAGLSQISGENEIKGTLCFMAPEQVANCRYTKPVADIFSVGATLYSLVSGEMIYDFRDHRTPLAAILNGGAVPLSDRVDAPAGLVLVVEKALARDPDERYQTAGEFRSALEPLCA